MSVSQSILKMILGSSAPLSGEKMARELNVSRTAVWKGIKHLQDRGFRIEARPGVGYILTGYPNKLLPELIETDLKTEIVGRKVFCFDVINSTNTQAKAMAAEGLEEGAVLTAEAQTDGKGRIDRKWFSPEGQNLLFSIIFRPKLLPSQIFCLNMVASISLVEAIEEISPLKPLIKWPNDVYVNNRKLAGILTEFSGAADGIDYAIVGIGLNVNFDPSGLPDIDQPATSLKRELGKSLSRLELLRTVLRKLDYHYRLLLQGFDDTLRGLWNSRSLVLGRKVTITSFGNQEHGTAISIDKDGALILEDQVGNTKRIICGDVSLRLN